SNLVRFMKKHNIQNYDDLMQRSIRDIRWFWQAVLEDLDIRFYLPYTNILDDEKGPEFPRWCVEGRMNIIHNCLDKWQQETVAGQDALRWEGEEGVQITLSYRELYESVNRCANALRQLGIGKGDAVGLLMPMIPELIVAFLAVIKIGGIILPLFSGYGPAAIATRLKDAGAKALFTADGFWRRAKAVSLKTTADEALESVPTVKDVIVVSRTGAEDISWNAERDHWWHELVPGQPAECETEQTEAEDVLMIIYTSGTTGKPKGAVHTHCGFPVKAAQDLYHSMDLKKGETLYWMTDMGWMMGPWEVFGALLIGATMVIYDGAPDYPGPDRLWQLVENHKVTHLGISPTLIRSLKVYGTAPVQKHNIHSLRMVGSTGSPWDPESWMWLFRNALHENAPILNYSGGTEISGGILCGNFFKPLKPCAFSGPVPGMDADVVDEEGEPVRRAVGELVLRQPWIGMTRGFWKAEERYLDSYWRKLPGLWFHGDYAAIDEDGLWYILGRSDDTIKVAGKRLGPAEVEALVNSHSAVAESAAIGVPHALKDQVVVLFCVLSAEVEPSAGLRNELIEFVTRELGKSLRPREIKFVTALPKTRNAKVMRRLIRTIYLNEEPGDLSGLEDHSTLEAIRKAR
ncbi:MAG: AMP-binding protein, partial [Calditrichia bacterium]